jgi:hypothetical protein
MILPGLISLVFYKRTPRPWQVIVGLLATVALSALLGYVSPTGPLTRDGSVLVAIIGGVILYVVVLAFLYYRYHPKSVGTPRPTSPTTPP